MELMKFLLSFFSTVFAVRRALLKHLFPYRLIVQKDPGNFGKCQKLAMMGRYIHCCREKDFSGFLQPRDNALEQDQEEQDRYQIYFNGQLRKENGGAVVYRDNVLLSEFVRENNYFRIIREFDVNFQKYSDMEVRNFIRSFQELHPKHKANAFNYQNFAIDFSDYFCNIKFCKVPSGRVELRRPLLSLVLLQPLLGLLFNIFYW